MDSKKSDQDQSKSARRRQFGDLIIWKEMLQFSKKEQRDIVFVTDDRKEDWWRRVSGRTIGPRPELVEEFFATTGHSFEMYEAHNFFEKSNQFFKIQSGATVAKEIKEISRRRRSTSETRNHLASNSTLPKAAELPTMMEQRLLLQREAIEAEIDFTSELLKSGYTDDADDETRIALRDRLAHLYAELEYNKKEYRSLMGKAFMANRNVTNIKKHLSSLRNSFFEVNTDESG
jgi:hypothetical protein